MCYGNYALQQIFAAQLLRELAKHALIVYPAFELYRGLEGKLMAHKDRFEHQTV